MNKVKAVIVVDDLDLGYANQALLTSILDAADHNLSLFGVSRTVPFGP